VFPELRSSGFFYNFFFGGGLFYIVVAYCHWNRMPRSSLLTRELNSLPMNGGVSGRRCRKEESQWNFNIDFCTSLVTPARIGSSSPLSDVEDEIIDSDSASSSEYSDLESEVYNSETECKEHTGSGNHLINLPSIVNSIQCSTICSCCAN